MRRVLKITVPVTLVAVALVGLGATLAAPEPVSRATVSAPTTTAVPTPAVAAAPLTTGTAVIVTAPTTELPRPAAQKAPAAPKPTGVDQWHATFNRMAAELPGTYVAEEREGALGLTPHDSDTAYIAPRTPVNILADVMRHESMHIRMTRVYGTASKAYEGLKAYGGWEAVADCGARMLGARWTGYVKSCTANMNHAAQAILNGVRA